MEKLSIRISAMIGWLLIVSASTFGQNGLSSSNSSLNASDASTIYSNWKSSYVYTWTSNGSQYGRVKWQSGAFWDPCLDRSEGPNVTASEGIGYGMVLAAYNNDQDLFDRLLNFMELVIVINNPSHELMPWLVWGIHDPANGKNFGAPICANDVARSGANPATDGDMDMAFGLIKAIDNGWSRSGGDSYGQVARKILGILMDDYISSCSIDNNAPAGLPASDWVFAPYPFGGCNTSKLTHNLSYYAPGYFRVFADFMNDANWDNLAEATYRHIRRLKSKRGGNLVPNFSKADGTLSEDHGNSTQTNQNYHYDAARVPWRIAMDYVWNSTGEAQQAFLDEVNYTFLGPISASQVVDGYRVQNGNPSFSTSNSPAFYGGFACGLMAQANNSYNQNKLNQFASRVKSTSASSGYFNYTLTALYALLLSGEFDKPSVNGGGNGNNNGGNNGGLANGRYRVKNVWSGLYLNGSNNVDFPVEVANLTPARASWGSMQWNVSQVSGTSDEYRFQSNWGGLYMHNIGSFSGAAVQTKGENATANAQKWILEPVSGNRYRLKSRRGGKYLNAGNTEWDDAEAINLNSAWTSMQWELEYLGPQMRKAPEAAPALEMYPNPSTGIVYLKNTAATEVNIVGIAGNSLGRFPIAKERIDISALPAGIYILLIDETAKRLVKIAK